MSALKEYTSVHKTVTIHLSRTFVAVIVDTLWILMGTTVQTLMSVLYIQMDVLTTVKTLLVHIIAVAVRGII